VSCFLARAFDWVTGWLTEVCACRYNRIYPVVNGTATVTGTSVYPKSAGGVPHVLQGTGGAFYPVRSARFLCPIYSCVLSRAHYEKDSWPAPLPAWSAVTALEYGYGRVTANSTHLQYEFVAESTASVADVFWIVRD
jgi:hypothetical protein